MNYVPSYSSYLIYDDIYEKIFLYNYNKLNNAEKEIIVINLNENFFDDVKSRFDKAKKVANKLNDDAKEVLNKIVDASKKASDFVKYILDNISKYVDKIMSDSKSKIYDKLKANGEIISSVKSKLDENPTAFYKDLKTCKNVSIFYKNKFKDSLLLNVKNSLIKILTDGEQKDIALSENFISDAKNVLDKLVDKVSHIPPFSYLHKIQIAGEKGATQVIKALSDMTNNIGGPSFELPVIAAILGIAIEYNIKGLVKSGMLDMVSFFSIPFISVIIKTVGYVATFIALYDLIDEITQTHKVREDGLEDEHHSGKH